MFPEKHFKHISLYFPFHVSFPEIILINTIIIQGRSFAFSLIINTDN